MEDDLLFGIGKLVFFRFDYFFEKRFRFDCFKQFHLAHLQSGPAAAFDRINLAGIEQFPVDSVNKKVSFSFRDEQCFPLSRIFDLGYFLFGVSDAFKQVPEIRLVVLVSDAIEIAFYLHVWFLIWSFNHYLFKLLLL